MRKGPDKQIANEQLAIPAVGGFSIQPHLAELVNLFAGTKNWEELPAEIKQTPGKNQRLAAKNDLTITPVIAAMAATLESQTPADIDLHDHVQEFLECQFDRSSLTDSIVAAWVFYLKVGLRDVRDMKVAAETLTPVLKDEIEHDPYQAFKLIKILAAKPQLLGEAHTDNEGEAVALLCSYDHHVQSGTGLTKYLAKSLQEGAFDRQLATDMLQQAAAPGPDKSERNGTAEILKYLKLIQIFGRLNQEAAIDVLAAKTGSEAWDGALATHLELYRARIHEDLMNGVRERQHILQNDSFILPSDPEVSLESAINTYKKKMATIPGYVVHGLRLKASKAELMAMRAQKRQVARNKRGFSGEVTQHVAPERQFPMLETPRDLLFYEGAGDFLPSNDITLAGVVSDYLKTAKGDTILLKDLNDVLDYLQLVDLGAERARGLEPHYSDATLHGVKVGTIWQFKPDASPYLTMHTKKGKKMRVLFTFEEGSVNIIAIADRDDIPTKKRNLGLSVSGSVKRDR